MKKINKGSPLKPRMYIFKSNKHIYVQIIDDSGNRILTSSSTLSKKNKKTVNCETAEKVGQDIAQKLKKQGIKKIIFDRGKNIYHGQVKALANATRNEGIEF
uniref:Large ribosomal subunit protein uL18c n=1 Tax=Taenioma perpusillum TaxID=210852 RepID=A0A1Z1MRG4_9FLOR|nr:ribosomal protein L18 [Taenioma perpusillum]ARW68556.1 ribosomal protein L18 [Taenioma perpusillum]